MSNVPIALQLYTVREEIANDFEGTLREVAKIGYSGVEFAGFGDMPAPDLYRLLQALKLVPVAVHVPIDQLEEAPEPIIEYSLEIETPYLVVPWLPEGRRRDRKKWRSVANLLTEIARDLQDYELKLCYHNHAFEFERFGEEYGFDIFFEKADPTLVLSELDTYWVQYGGEDPAEYIRKLSGRCPLIHLKDMADNKDRSFAEIGAGTMDFDAIFQAAEAGGVEWYIVEQDECPGPPLESARKSFENLKGRGKV